MALIETSEIRNVYGITKEQEEKICSFLQGAVYCWCKNRPDEWFSMRDLMGGENYYWEETPLIALYEKHQNKETAIADAGKDSGWLLKKVISDDKRSFHTKKEEELIKKNSLVNDEEYFIKTQYFQLKKKLNQKKYDMKLQKITIKNFRSI